MSAKQEHTYEVIVGNMGTVHRGTNYHEAKLTFSVYKGMSKENGVGPAARTSPSCATASPPSSTWARCPLRGWPMAKLTRRTWYTRGGSQVSTGSYPMFVLGDPKLPWDADYTDGATNLRCMVRHMKWEQLGNFMHTHVDFPCKVFHPGHADHDTAAVARITNGGDGLPMHCVTGDWRQHEPWHKAPKVERDEADGLAMHALGTDLVDMRNRMVRMVAELLGVEPGDGGFMHGGVRYDVVASAGDDGPWVVTSKGVGAKAGCIPWDLAAFVNPLGKLSAPCKRTPKKRKVPTFYARGVPVSIYQRMTPVPKELAHAYAKSVPGAEQMLSRWVEDNVRTLRESGKPRAPWSSDVGKPPCVYKVQTLDVWGNRDDGYEINNWFNVGTVKCERTLYGKARDRALVKALVEADILAAHITLRDVYIEDVLGGGILTVCRRYGERRDEPLLQLTCEDEA